MGCDAWKHRQLTDGYACEEGTSETGRWPKAQIPFLVEAWVATCESQDNADDVRTNNNRGTFYEPHTSQVIPLGTLTVEAYRRSPWLYQSVLICEKEDNVHMLRDSGHGMVDLVRPSEQSKS